MAERCTSAVVGKGFVRISPLRPSKFSIWDYLTGSGTHGIHWSHRCSRCYFKAQEPEVTISLNRFIELARRFLELRMCTELGRFRTNRATDRPKQETGKNFTTWVIRTALLHQTGSRNSTTYHSHFPCVSDATG